VRSLRTYGLAQGSKADQEGGGSTDDVKDWIGSTVAKIVRATENRTKWRSWMSLALTLDPQE